MDAVDTLPCRALLAAKLLSMLFSLTPFFHSIISLFSLCGELANDVAGGKLVPVLFLR